MSQSVVASETDDYSTAAKTQTRFPLMRYFAAVSLVVIVLVSAGAGLLVVRGTRNELIKRGESYAISAAQHLNSDLHHRFGSPLDLRALMTRLDGATGVQDDLYGLSVERVKLYDASGIIVYSDIATLIGVDDSENLHVQDALTGQASSKLVQMQQSPDVAGEPDLTVDVLETYVPLYDLSGTGQVIGVVEIYQDVPSIHQQVRQLQVWIITTAILTSALLFLSLLGLIYRADRIIERQFTALRQANIELLALQWTKDDLVRMIAHDLKNPLASLLLNLSLLLGRKDPLSERQVQRVDAALQSGAHLLAMIGDMLDVTKMEEDHLVPQIESLQLADVIAEATDGLTYIAEARGQSLTLSLPDDLPPVLADRDLLRRVLDNLISNALKYTHTLVEISAAPYTESGYVQIVVRDDGAGIPPELHETIFDRFSQVQDADARTGTGLGLTFCKLAVEAHGGRIWIESEMEQGSRFAFTIPVVHAESKLG